MSPFHLTRVIRALPGPVAPSPAQPFVLLILVLFVVWLLAAGNDLASATAAAVAVSWASGAAGRGTPPAGLISRDPQPGGAPTLPPSGLVRG
jgi:hypothetical protein